VEGNQRAAEIIGRPVSEIPGLPLKAFVRGNANVTGPVLPMLRYGHVTTGEFWVSRPDGSRIPVEIRATMLEDGRVQVIARDITERKEVERVKDEFVSVVSHELRTPLTSIRGALGLLAAGRLDDAPERRQRMLDLAASNTDRLIRLINDILDIERINSGGVTFEREPIDVATLVDAVVEPFRITGEKAGVTITTDVEPVQVWADPDRLTQTLTNLVDNAIKFSPRDSTVEISVRRDGRFGLFEVRDHGRGIPVEMLDAVFDRFQQVDNSDAREKGGSGLGLAISRSIVEQHGGRIWVQSTPGDGSAFRFTIPLLTERQAPSEDGGARALVVDDDSDLVEVMRATLSARGYQVFGASRGKEAIERFDEIGADLVVLDILLPDISGLRVLRHVNSTRPETKIVVYTATYLEGAERDFIRGVGAAIVTKGRTAPEQLADEIERIVSPRVASAPRGGQTG
jgi:PAS domain S-box-containing protein